MLVKAFSYIHIYFIYIYIHLSKKFNRLFSIRIVFWIVKSKLRSWYSIAWIVLRCS